MGETRRFWAFKPAAEDKPAELTLNGIIAAHSWWGDEVTPADFVRELAALGDVKELTLRISSEGGDVFAAQQIYTILNRHQATITGHVDSVAASAASLVLMAADRIVMPANALLMVHNPWTTAVAGNSKELRKLADDLDVVLASMLPTYMQKTGRNEEDVRALLDAETWMTAETAKAEGFCDEVAPLKAMNAMVRPDGLWEVNGQVMDLARYPTAPVALLSADVPTPDAPQGAVTVAPTECERRARIVKVLALREAQL